MPLKKIRILRTVDNSLFLTVKNINTSVFTDVAVNLRPSVFERILEPSDNASSHSLQLELHFRATQGGTTFMIILNNMKLMCSFDWLITVHEFIMTKAENPFMTGIL